MNSSSVNLVLRNVCGELFLIGFIDNDDGRSDKQYSSIGKIPERINEKLIQFFL